MNPTTNKILTKHMSLNQILEIFQADVAEKGGELEYEMAKTIQDLAGAIIVFQERLTESK